jgi:dihydropteroate synthase
MRTRVLRIENQSEAKDELKKIGVYFESLKYMCPKLETICIKLKDINSAACNILKQEMLSAGGDVAVSKEVITGRVKKSDCLVIGTPAQIKTLSSKIKKQPLGLDRIGVEIKKTLNNYKKTRFKLICRRYSLNLSGKVHICGVLNVTPDSFSDGGKFFDEEKAIEGGLNLEKEGADIIDVGGESTQPQAKRVKPKKQIERVVPVIKKLSKKLRIPISVDTQSFIVAEAAVKAGASIINDISGLKYDKRIAELAAKYKTGLILVHIKGTPKDMQKNPVYACLIQDIIDSLNKSINCALEAGVKPEQIAIDPGIGFGKTTEHNLSILKHISEFKSLGYPIMIGTSRKSMIGNTLDRPVDKRLLGTAATVTHSILGGVKIIRVHDVNEIKDVVRMTEAIEKSKVQ